MPELDSFEKSLISAVQTATRRLASSGNFDSLLKDVLAICVEAVGATGGTIYLHEGNHRLRFQHVLPEDVLPLLPSLDMADDFGAAGQAYQTRKTIVKEFPDKPKSEWNEFERATGVPLHSMIAAPLMMESEEPIGVVQLLNKREGRFTAVDAAVLDTVAAVSTMAYHNYKLHEESSRASTLLGMGKVSHDIGNLAASLHAGAALLQMEADQIDAESPEARTAAKEAVAAQIEDLKLSITRIVGYSRLVSDMSAGRKVRPELNAFNLGATVLRSASYLEAQARSQSIRIRYEVDENTPAFPHDELFVFRIVQNLIGNALKAVAELGSSEAPAEDGMIGTVTVGCCFSDGHHRLYVADSGPGMPAHVVDRILEGTARSQWDKSGGSGWGTKIVLELAEALSGRLSIESQPGSGSSFIIDFTEPDLGTRKED